MVDKRKSKKNKKHSNKHSLHNSNSINIVIHNESKKKKSKSRRKQNNSTTMKTLGTPQIGQAQVVSSSNVPSVGEQQLLRYFTDTYNEKKEAPTITSQALAPQLLLNAPPEIPRLENAPEIPRIKNASSPIKTSKKRKVRINKYIMDTTDEGFDRIKKLTELRAFIKSIAPEIPDSELKKINGKNREEKIKQFKKYLSNKTASSSSNIDLGYDNYETPTKIHNIDEINPIHSFKTDIAKSGNLSEDVNKHKADEFREKKLKQNALHSLVLNKEVNQGMADEDFKNMTQDDMTPYKYNNPRVRNLFVSPLNNNPLNPHRTTNEMPSKYTIDTAKIGMQLRKTNERYQATKMNL